MPKQLPRADLQDPEVQDLVNKMTNHQRCKWARAGYSDVKQFLGIKPKRRRTKKAV